MFVPTRTNINNKLQNKIGLRVEKEKLKMNYGSSKRISIQGGIKSGGDLQSNQLMRYTTSNEGIDPYENNKSIS